MGNITRLNTLGEQPAWAVPYGKGFWRHARESGTNIDAFDAIERVSYALRATECGFEVAAHDYRANWDGHGVYMSTGGNGLDFRTESIIRGNRICYASGSGFHQWVVLGNTIQAQLNGEVGLLEHHEARGNGVEVTWVISEMPGGDGPLQIGVRCSGMPCVGESATGYRFKQDKKNGSVIIGRVTAVDRIGQRWALDTEFEGDIFKIQIPETLLLSASYPLAIDPLISPEFGTDDPVLSAAPENQANPGASDNGARNPDVAFNGSIFMVVWSDLRVHPTSDDIWGTRVSLTGVILDPYGIPISSQPNIQAAPKVASHGGEFFVIWNDERKGEGTPGALYGTRLTANGEVLDRDGILISSSTLSSRSAITHAIAPTSYGYFAVWGDGRNNGVTGQDIYGARIGAGGTILDPQGIAISQSVSNQWAVDVEASGPNLLVVWNDDRNHTSISDIDIYGTIMTESGAVLHPKGVPICTAAGTQTGPAVAGDSAGFLVVWTDFRNSSSEGDIYGTRVSGSGTALNPAGVPIYRAAGHQESVALASNGDLYFLVWKGTQGGKDELFGTRVTSAGTVLDPNAFVITTSPTESESAPVIAAGPDRFLVAWMAVGNFPGYQIESTLVSADGVSKPDPMLLSTGAHRQETPAIASNGENYLVVWSDYRDEMSAGRQDIYGVRVDRAGNVLDPNGIAICTVTNRQMLPAVASNGRDYLVVWHDERPRVNSADIYAARVTGGGTLIDPDGLAICRATNVQTAPSVASSGKNYFVTWQDGRVANQVRIYGTRVSDLGQVAVPDGLRICNVSSDQRDPAIASAGAEYLLAWRDGRGCAGCQDIYGARVNDLGEVLDPAGIPVSTATGNQSAPAIAAGTSEYLVVWEDLRNNAGSFFVTNSDIFGARVNLAGEVLDPAGIAISVTISNQSSPAVAHYRNGYFVAWTDARFGNMDGGSSDLFGARIRHDGTLLDASGMPINTNRFYQRFPAIAQCRGSEMLAACQTVRDGTLRIGCNLLLINEAPTTVPEQQTVDEDAALPITLMGSDVDADPLTFVITEPPSHGVLTGTSSNLLYHPSADYFGEDSFTYVVSDGEVDSSPATVTITVNPVNDPPRFTPGQDVVVVEDAGEVIVSWARNVLPGPENELDQTVSFEVRNNNERLFSVPPALDSGGTLWFVPAQNANGSSEFTVILRDTGDGQNASARFTFRVLVQAVNDPPTAEPQHVTVSEDDSIPISLSAADVDGDNLTYSINPPSHGTLRGTAPRLIYTPQPNYSGPDRFTFKASDGQIESPPAEVSIQVLPVNDAPVPVLAIQPIVTLLSNQPPVVISKDNIGALVRFDGSRSSDIDSAILEYAWYKDGRELPFATGAAATNFLYIGQHYVALRVFDGAAAGTATVSVNVISVGEATDAILYLIEQLNVGTAHKRPLTVLSKAARKSFDDGRFDTGLTLLRALQAKAGARIAADDPEGAARLVGVVQTIIDALREP